MSMWMQVSKSENKMCWGGWMIYAYEDSDEVRADQRITSAQGPTPIPNSNSYQPKKKNNDIRIPKLKTELCIHNEFYLFKIQITTVLCSSDSCSDQEYGEPAGDQPGYQ